jgi:N-acetylneuraminic acid mutarotase
MGIATLEGKIHVFGGRQNDYTDMLDRHDVYDPSTATWTARAPLPRPRSAGAFAVLDGRIVYAGGECKPGGAPFSANTFEDVDTYDATTDKWGEMEPLPEGRHAFGGATIDGVAYFAGGALLCGGGATTDLLALSSKAG